MSSNRKIGIMGIVNATDNSFYPGSRSLGLDPSEIERRIGEMTAQGADIIDIGACSTAPGTVPVPEEEEWRRIRPVLEVVRGSFPDTCISIDTFRSGIVRRACDFLGREFIVNDVSSGKADAGMLSLVGSLGFSYVAVHGGGDADCRQGYEGGVVNDARLFFDDFALNAEKCGISRWIMDPGFGFSKSLDENWELLRNLHELKRPGVPLLVALSRKSMIYKLLGISPEDALAQTQTANLLALISGADILRVHDVKECLHTITIYKKALCS